MAISLTASRENQAYMYSAVTDSVLWVTALNDSPEEAGLLALSLT